MLLLCTLHDLWIGLGLREDLAGLLLLGVQVDGGLRRALFFIIDSKKVQRVFLLLRGREDEV